MNKQDVIELDLKQLFLALWKKAWLLMLAMVICGVSAYLVTEYAMTPMYRSNVKMYVNNSSISVGSTQVSISGSDISAAQTLVDTYIVILESRSVLNAVIEHGNLNCTVEQLDKMITASSINDTEIFKIEVINPDASMAAHIGNTIAEVLPDKIATIVDGSSVRVVDFAVEAAEPYEPSHLKNTILGCILGLLVSAMLVVVMSIFNETIDSEDVLTQNFDIPILSVIPDVRSEKSGKNGYYKGGYYQRDPDQSGGAI